MPLILTSSISNSSTGVPGQQLQQISVPYDATTTLDTLSSGRVVRWMYTLSSPDDSSKTIFGEVQATMSPDKQTVSFSWFNIVGDIDTMKHNIDVVYNNGTLEFNVTNNDQQQHDWQTSIVRIDVA